MPLPAASNEADQLGSLWRRLTRGVRRLRQASDWESFAGAGWPERIMTEDVRDRLFAKQGRTIARWTVFGPDGRSIVVYLKRHYRLGRWAGFLATLFPRKARSPGLQEWEHLQWAAAQDLPVPRAMAAGELIGPWFRLQSFIAVAELTGMLALHEAIPLAQGQLSPGEFRHWKRSLADELARLARSLHGRHVFHKDFYLCHFFVREEDTTRVPESWTGAVSMIDLHRLGRHSVTRHWWTAKDLAQLLYSSDDVSGVTARDRVGFWRAYGRRNGLIGRLLTWAIRIKWRLYQRHNRK
jgi:heptose I phosphotransferase